MCLLTDLIRGDACRRFEAADLVDLDAFIGDAAVHIFQNISRKILRGGVQLFIERRKLVDVSVIEILHDLVSGRFEIDEVDQESDVVQLLAARIDLDPVIVTMKVLALPLVPAQLMRG